MSKTDHRPVPHSEDNEKALLGSVLLAPGRVLDECTDRKVTDDFFFHPSNRIIYAAMQDMRALGENVHLVSLGDYLTAKKLYEEVGGPGYIAELFNGVQTASNFAYYIEVLREKRMARKALEIIDELTRVATDPGQESRIGEVAQKGLMEIAGLSESKAVTKSLGTVIVGVIDILEAINAGTAEIGLPTGIEELDRAIRGLSPGNMIVIAAQTKRGKTALAQQIGIFNASQGTPTGFYSLEMSDFEIGMRALAGEASHDFSKITKGTITPLIMGRLTGALNKMGHFPFYVRDESTVTIEQIQASARKLVYEMGCKLLIIDYLQLVTASNKRDNREQQVAHISSSIKKLAGDLRIPIIVMSQLNRQDQARESAAIENDANVFLVIEETVKTERKRGQDGKMADIPMLDTKGQPMTSHCIFVKYARACPNIRIPVLFRKPFSRFEGIPAWEPQSNQ